MFKAERIKQYLIEKHGFKYEVFYNKPKEEEVQSKKSHFFHKTMKLVPFSKPTWKVKIEEVSDYSEEARQIITELKWEVADEMNDNPKTIWFKIIKEKEETDKDAVKEVSVVKNLSNAIKDATKMMVVWSVHKQ